MSTLATPPNKGFTPSFAPMEKLPPLPHKIFHLPPFSEAELLLLVGFHPSWFTYPKHPGMSYERDFPYNPILGMGLRPSILL